MMIDDDRQTEPCVYCREDVVIESELAVYVAAPPRTLGDLLNGLDGYAHARCREAYLEENGPGDDVLDPHGVGEVGWAKDH